jgi:cytochrome c-type biogenesis protein CcmH
MLAIAAAAPLVALAIYLVIGAPGFPDQPFARRLAQWGATPQPLETLTPPQLAELMRAAAARNPRDPGPLYFLARYELQSGELTEAAQALDKAIALAPGRADFWDFKGEIAVAQAQGDMSPQARTAFEHALALDPKSPGARFHLALAKIATGDVKDGLAEWRALEADLDPSDPRRASLAAAIAQVETSGPAALAQPAAPAVGGPQIQAMVDGLAARLKANPDDPDGWVRLVRAYGVLGETDRQAAALAEARRRYAGRTDVLDQLAQAARPAS